MSRPLAGTKRACGVSRQAPSPPPGGPWLSASRMPRAGVDNVQTTC